MVARADNLDTHAYLDSFFAHAYNVRRYFDMIAIYTGSKGWMIHADACRDNHRGTLKTFNKVVTHR